MPESIKQLLFALAWPIICERENGQKLEPFPIMASMIVLSQGRSISGGTTGSGSEGLV